MYRKFWFSIVGSVVWTILAQSNNDCSKPTQIDSFPYSAAGDTSLASSDFASTICQVDSEDKGLWYSLIGNGRAMTISVTDAQVDSQIALFSGSSCDQLFCRSYGTNTGYRNYGSSLTFLSEIGTDYRIHVSGHSGSTGTFTVNVVVSSRSILSRIEMSSHQWKAHEIPSNDGCESASLISVFPVNLSGTTIGAYTDVDSTFCQVDKDARGVWYLIVGDGEAKRVAVEAAAEFDSRIAVFSGSCGQLLCIGSNTNTGYARKDSAMTFLTDTGVKYYVLVSSSSPSVTNVGSFTLNVQSFERPPNDSCDRATPMTAFPVTLTGTTIGAYADVDSTICQVLPDARGVWYFIVGDGKAKYISVDNTAEFDSRVAVFSGGCGQQLVCIASNANSGYQRRDSQMTILTEVGEHYFILVSSSTSDVNNVGSFTMHVQSYDRPPNDSCEGAALVTALPATFSGNTIGAYPDANVPVCNIPSGSRGEWYRLVGNGNVITATVESSAAFDSRLAVFIGSCKELSCLQSHSNTSYRNFSSRLEIETDEGVVYFLLVTSDTGDIGSVGTYTLVFSGQGPLATFPVSKTMSSAPTPRPNVRSSTLIPSETPAILPRNFPPSFETGVPSQTQAISPTSPPQMIPEVEEAQLTATNAPTLGTRSMSPTVSPSIGPQSPLLTSHPSNAAVSDSTSTRTPNAQDYLIIANVILSFLKSSISVFVYSWGNVVFAVLELIVTSTTLAIFILNDFVNDDGTSQYGDNISVYLASFLISLTVEVVGVITICKTLSVYKRLRARDGLTEQGIHNAQKFVRGAYVFCFIYALVFSGGIVPSIAMSKANWVTEYFGPFDFTGKVETLVFCSVGLALLSQMLGGVYLLIASEETLLDALSGQVGWALTLQITIGIAYSILVYMTLSMVSGQEAGGFCYLFLINIPQVVELSAEVGRHVCLLKCLSLPEDILHSRCFLWDFFIYVLSEQDPAQADQMVELAN